nr:hypothetical protein [Bacteroidota bacterium]
MNEIEYPKTMRRIVLLVIIIAMAIPAAFSQKYGSDQEQILIWKPWIIVNVKGKNHKLAVGEELKFNIEKTFSFKKNDYTTASGTWKLNGNELLMVVETYSDEQNFRVPKFFRIKKLTKSEIVLKFKDGKTKGTVYLK